MLRVIHIQTLGRGEILEALAGSKRFLSAGWRIGMTAKFI
jgi:hypothetical protein